MEKKFDEFMAGLDGHEFNDRALIDNMYFQCDRLARESGKPLAIKVSKHHDRVGFGKVTGYDDFNMLVVYYTVNGEYMTDEFATKPVFPTTVKDDYGNAVTIYSEYRHTRFGSRDELLKYRSWDIDGTAATEYALANYYFDERDEEKKKPKLMIDGFFNMWNRVAGDKLA